MKRILAGFAVFMFAAFATAEHSDAKYRELPPELDGTMMPYEFTAEADKAVWPDSLRPVKVVYAARHGARYLSSEKKVDAVEETLLQAMRDGKLTSEGKAFLELTRKVREKSNGRWGELSDVGKEEERRLGLELASLCPALLKDTRVNAVATYVPRVVMTMYEFCHALALSSGDVEVYAAEGKQFSPLLRFFDTDTRYHDYIKHGGWKQIYEDFVNKTVPIAPAVRLVGKESGFSDNGLRKLSLDMYEVLQGLRASTDMVPTTRWMTEEEYRACWAAENLDHYLLRVDNTYSSLAPSCAVPLLSSMMADILDPSADPVNLYFGHAETVMPLFSLMNLPGCDTPALTPEEVSVSWNDSRISPLGANVMIVVLQSPSGHLYASLRLNGRFVPPVTDNPSTTIPLQTLLDFWTSRISQFR